MPLSASWDELLRGEDRTIKTETQDFAHFDIRFDIAFPFRLEKSSAARALSGRSAGQATLTIALDS